MDKEEVLEEETAEVEDTEEAEEEEVALDSDEEEEDDYGFEYDEDGNVIIPEIEPDAEDEDPEAEEGEEETNEDSEEDTEENAEEKEEDTSSGEKGFSSSQGEGNAEPPAPDPKDELIKQLRAELGKYKSQTKDTLKKLGREGKEDLDGLAEIAAEAAGVSPEEYQKIREKEEAEEQAKAAIRSQMFEAKAANDLKELHAAYPETQKYKHVRELPEGVRQKFGRYRDLGLSAKEAYAAANPDGVRADVAASVKKQEQHNSKAHLTSVVPKSSKDNSVKMTGREMREWREMFPGKSDAEIQKLYKQSKPKY